MYMHTYRKIPTKKVLIRTLGSLSSLPCHNCNDCIYFLLQALKFHIACDLTAQEVYDLGQNEVKRIRSRMDKVKKNPQVY